MRIAAASVAVLGWCLVAVCLLAVAEPGRARLLLGISIVLYVFSAFVVVGW